MRLLILGAAALLLGGAAPKSETAAGIAELAGRTAGPPQKCITFEQSESMRVAKSNALIYGHGRPIYLNSAPGCSGFKSSDVLILQPIGSRYCRGDFVRSRDNVSGLPGAGCRLGDFIPYTRN